MAADQSIIHVDPSALSHANLHRVGAIGYRARSNGETRRSPSRVGDEAGSAGAALAVHGGPTGHGGAGLQAAGRGRAHDLQQHLRHLHVHRGESDAVAR